MFNYKVLFAISHVLGITLNCSHIIIVTIVAFCTDVS